MKLTNSSTKNTETLESSKYEIYDSNIILDQIQRNRL